MVEKITNVYILSGYNKKEGETHYMYSIPALDREGGLHDKGLTEKEGITNALSLAVGAIVPTRG